MMKYIGFVVVAFLMASSLVFAGSAASKATAVIKDSEGKTVGHVILQETPHGVLLTTELTDMPAGVHAFHIHSVGKCEPPFKSAAGHLNPYGKEHGIKNAKGYHAGDLPNIYVGSDGKLKFDVLAHQVTLKDGENTLFDDDGSAIVVHSGPDDYMSDPAGNAGPRIACGVIEK